MRYAVMTAALLAATCMAGSARAEVINHQLNSGAIAQSATPSPAVSGSTYGTSLLSAVVDGDSTLQRRNGAISATHQSTGNYIVLFSRNVRSCAYIATTGLSGAAGTLAASIATVVGAAADVRGVWVSTYDATGTATDQPFHLFVDCAG